VKIILSKKGFDSSDGGVASPILPDGTLLSLPILLSSPISYGELHINGHLPGRIAEDLTHGRITRRHGTHLDPDLTAGAYPRLPGWRPLFGQVGAAQSHLAHSGIAVGDLLLFFGWFRQTKMVGGRYRFVSQSPDLHVIFGWLQIGEIISVRRGGAPEWAMYHPHFHGEYAYNNTVYISRRNLQMDRVHPVAGAGAFSHYHDDLRLTMPGCPRTTWQLPRWFYPVAGKSPLRYHSNMQCWSLTDGHAILHSVARGQEFVLDADQYPEAIAWACNLILRRCQPSGWGVQHDEMNRQRRSSSDMTTMGRRGPTSEARFPSRVSRPRVILGGSWCALRRPRESGLVKSSLFCTACLNHLRCTSTGRQVCHGLARLWKAVRLLP